MERRGLLAAGGIERPQGGCMRWVPLFPSGGVGRVRAVCAHSSVVVVQ